MRPIVRDGARLLLNVFKDGECELIHIVLLPFLDCTEANVGLSAEVTYSSSQVDSP